MVSANPDEPMERPLTEDEISLSEVDASAAPLMDHLIELRRRLIISVIGIAIGFAISFVFSRQLFDFLVLPFQEATNGASIYFKPLGFFFAQIRLALFGGIILAFPLVAFQIYKFVAPGLYKHERQAIAPFVMAMPVLFTAGAALVYYVMVPFVMRFAVGFEATTAEGAPTNYELLTDVGDYLSLVTTLMLAFGFAFQLPVLLTLFGRAGLLTAAQLKKVRKFAIVGIFAVAAFLTPPDPFSQIVLALTVIALYEISVVSVGMAEKKANRKTVGG